MQPYGESFTSIQNGVELSNDDPALDYPLWYSRVFRSVIRIAFHDENRSLMNVGTAWHDYQAPADKERSFELLDAYVAAGGNTVDTANGYQVRLDAAR